MGILNKILKSEDEEKKEVQEGAEVKDVKKDIAKEDKPKKKVKEAKSDKKTETKKVSKEDTKNAYKVLIKPIISEKATEAGHMNKYIFEVADKATKNEIKKAISAVYGIKPLSVNVINVMGKKVRFGRTAGSRKDWRKAIVTLPKDKTIQLYEGI